MSGDEFKKSRALIKILDEGTICRIAAGEVVVSGAYAIKEMIENSIDAGADEIVIEYSGAGLSSITVSDNGCGMTRDDILMALEHHATSKLSTASDLNEINTYGFRGEALPSIAAVSRCEIISSIDSTLPAVCVKIEGGIIKSVQNAASLRGTRISVKNLFYNTPVRKKFLKSENYENSLIIDFVTRYALARPEIKFSLYSGGREIFITRRGCPVEETIAAIFPGVISGSLINVEEVVNLGEYGEMRVKILMSPPHVSKPSARYQHYFVNGRPFKNKSISHAVYAAYQRYMAPKQYPVVFAFINMPQKYIDVNIHPTKTEVAFACEFKIHDAVKKIVSSGLVTVSAVPRGNISSASGPFPAVSGAGNVFPGAGPDSSFTSKRPLNVQNSNFILNSYFKSRTGQCVSGEPIETSSAESISDSVSAPPVEDVLVNVEDSGQRVLFDDPADRVSFNSADRKLVIKKIIGQAFDAFIVAEDEDGLLLIDQHVAAEKVFYEKFLAALLKGDFISQSFITPHIYEPGISEFEMLKQNFHLFNKYGFDVEIFSEKSIVVRAAPDFLDGAEEKNMIYEIISAGMEAGGIDEPVFCDKVAARMACKAAVKAGKLINMQTARMMIEDLQKCANPYFCPHGRPVIIKIELKDLLAKFKRSL